MDAEESKKNCVRADADPQRPRNGKEHRFMKNWKKLLACLLVMLLHADRNINAARDRESSVRNFVFTMVPPFLCSIPCHVAVSEKNLGRRQ